MSKSYKKTINFDKNKGEKEIQNKKERKKSKHELYNVIQEVDDRYINY